MPRKIASIVIAGFIIVATWAIPKYLEVNNMITQQNSYWLLYAVYIGAVIVICVLIWGYWSMIKRVRFQIPFKLAKLESGIKENQATIPEGIDFYISRTSLGSDLEERLSKFGALTVWASFWYGMRAKSDHFFVKTPLWKYPPLDELILLDPNSEYFQIHSKMVENRDLSEEIKATASQAMDANVDVRYYSASMMDALVIAFKTNITERDVDFINGDLTHDAWTRVDANEAWVKVDLAIPWRDSQNCPNFIVHNKKQGKLFKALVKHYIRMWYSSGKTLTQDTKQSTLDKGDSQS
jgi:hypothetical protein